MNFLGIWEILNSCKTCFNMHPLKVLRNWNMRAFKVLLKRLPFESVNIQILLRCIKKDSENFATLTTTTIQGVDWLFSFFKRGGCRQIQLLQSLTPQLSLVCVVMKPLPSVKCEFPHSEALWSTLNAHSYVLWNFLELPGVLMSTLEHSGTLCSTL